MLYMSGFFGGPVGSARKVKVESLFGKVESRVGRHTNERLPIC